MRHSAQSSVAIGSRMLAIRKERNARTRPARAPRAMKGTMNLLGWFICFILSAELDDLAEAGYSQFFILRVCRQLAIASLLEQPGKPVHRLIGESPRGQQGLEFPGRHIVIPLYVALLTQRARHLEIASDVHVSQILADSYGIPGAFRLLQ